ncbi:MAG: hypothetical protein NTW79_01475 [Candidatus Berkelbacteria bacterium]|nr:hypothetical protein [Candidatus Berkelbacteria bacterium]
MSDLEFIKNEDLRLTLENSNEYIYAVLENLKKNEQSELYKEETYRVIILYVISAIEAVLLYFYKEREEKMEYLDYKFVAPLPKNYIHSEKNSFPVVIAVQEKVGKEDHRIGLNDLVTFFKNKKLIQPKTASQILELNEIRNTFHFSKPRTKKCSLEHVESALKLLLHTIEKAPASLKIK